MSRPQLPCSFALPYSDCLLFSVCCCHSSQEANEASKTDAVLPAAFLYPPLLLQENPLGRLFVMRYCPCRRLGSLQSQLYCHFLSIKTGLWWSYKCIPDNIVTYGIPIPSRIWPYIKFLSEVQRSEWYVLILKVGNYMWANLFLQILQHLSWVWGEIYSPFLL